MKIKDIYKVVTIDWTRKQMRLNSISQVDLVKKLEMSKPHISLLLNPNSRHPLSSKFHKIGIYYAISEIIEDKNRL